MRRIVTSSTTRIQASTIRAAAVLTLACLLAGGAAASGVLDGFRDPLEPPSTGGVAVVDRALAKLSGHRRVLVIGAHPDDEDTTLLALVARGLGGEAAYLSLSRGDGGQNLIGPELGPGLGLLRSRELLAARHVDGARQFFTRAYDFGYTRSLEETLERWPKAVLMEDAVRVLRRFRPQVVVSVFPPDPRAGHGQHQAAGLVAGEAYAAAADPAAFPELTAEGLPAWSPEAFYRNTWWRGREETTVTESAAVLDPVSGRSVFQIAMASRSRHRSQDMGMLQPLGPRDARLGWEAGGAGPEGRDLFAGVDTRLAAIADLLPAQSDEERAQRASMEEGLDRVQALAEEARGNLSPTRLDGAVDALAEIVATLHGVRGAVADGRFAGRESAAALHVAALLEEKIAVAETGLAAAAGLAVDAVADREAVAPGAAWTVETSGWNASGRADVELLSTELVSPAGLALAVDELPAEERQGFEAFFLPGDDPERGFQVRRLRATVAADAEPTEPYFLRRPLDGDLYDWSGAAPEVRGEPFGPPPLAARFHVRVAGQELTLQREVVYRFRDQAQGEVRRPLRVVPALEVAVAPDLLVQPLSHHEPHRLRVTLTSHADRDLAGTLELHAPAGWTSPSAAPAFSLPAGGRTEVDLPLSITPSAGPGRGEIGVAAKLADGEAYSLAVPLVDYEHVRPTPYPVAATVAATVTDLELPVLSRVAYVRGAADRVPEMLAEVGVPVEVLAPAALLEADLSVYDAVVVGPRAYETEPVLAAANPRLLDYARGGGLLLVQYQQYQFVDGGFAPFELAIDRPHGRVTDETAAVRLLVPDHPAFHVPNQIGPADWDGWVQERGLYFAGTWDEAAYTPLLAMRDPDQSEDLTGSLLVAPLGEGTYVYTGLAFFRQLPAGVPGAYRLFANLLALAE